jgi:membrane protein YdbS with pleckstrin-like domain
LFRSEGNLEADEHVLWKGKPLRMPFLVPIIYVALIGFAVDACLVTVAYFVFYHFVFIIFAFFVLAVCLGISYVRYRDWKETEYLVTNRRVFFDTLIGYDVVNMNRIKEVHLKRNYLDKYFGTGKVIVTYQGFNPTSTFSGRGGQVVVKQKPPLFQSIKDIDEVRRIIENAASISRLEK